MRVTLLMGVVIATCGSGLAQAQQAGTRRTDLQRHDLSVPAGKVHQAKNVGSSNGAELATYVVEKGKPLITLVK